MERLWFAAIHSIDGLVAAWRGEAAFRQEVVLTVFLIPLAGWVAPNAISGALMTGSILIVLIIELLNSAVEAVVDRTGLHHDNLAKKAKDTASAAVLIALLNAAITWAIVLLSAIA